MGLSFRNRSRRYANQVDANDLYANELYANESVPSQWHLPSGFFRPLRFFSIIFFSFFFFLFRKAASTKEKKKILKKKSFQNEIQLNGLDSGRDLERSSGLGTKISNNKKKPRNQSKESRHAQFLIGIQRKKKKIRCPFRWFFFVQRNGRYCKKIR